MFICVSYAFHLMYLPKIQNDAHHCMCYSIDPLDIDDFENELRDLEFHYPLFNQEKGQILSLVLTNGDDKQIHIKVMPDGQIEAEIEPTSKYPFAHLNQKHSYSAHKELGEFFSKHLTIHHKKKIIPPLTCIRRIIVEPINPTPIETIVVGAAASLIVVGVLYYLLKDDKKA